MALIQVTPDELRNKSTSLRLSRSKHDDAMREIDGIINALDSVWKGPAQSAFVEKYRGMKGKFGEFSDMIENYARLMDTAAAEMEEVDASILAKMRG